MTGTRLVVVAPHPDDEVIGCGGLIHKWCAAGAEAAVLWVCSRSTEAERAEAQRAIERLGVSESASLDFPPVGLSYDEPTLRRFVAELRRLRPTALLIPHANDADEQHRTTHQLAAESAWLIGYPIWEERGPLSPRPTLVLEYEVWSPIGQPNYYEDISVHLDAKLESLRCYSTQLAITPLDRAVAGLNQWRGAMGLGVVAAEAFQIREFRRSLTELQ